VAYLLSMDCINRFIEQDPKGSLGASFKAQRDGQARSSTFPAKTPHQEGPTPGDSESPPVERLSSKVLRWSDSGPSPSDYVLPGRGSGSLDVPTTSVNELIDESLKDD